MTKSKKKRFFKITIDDSELDNADEKLKQRMEEEKKKLGITSDEEYREYLDSELRSKDPELYRLLQEEIKRIDSTQK